MADWLQWLSELPPASALRRSATLYLLVNAAHILSVGLLVGAILPLDLRLAGVLRRGALSEIAPFLSRGAATGLLCAIVTGLCLFSVKPGEYVANPAFQAKAALLGLGVANVFLQHRGAAWNDAIAGAPVRFRTRLLAVASLLIWTATLVAGRWIGFV